MGRRELIFGVIAVALVTGYAWLGTQLVTAVGPISASPTPRPTAPAEQTGVPRVPGSIAFALRGDIYVLRDGRYAALTSEGRNSQPALSPDGATVYFARQEQIDGTRISDGQLVNARLAYSSIVRKPASGGSEELVLDGLRQKRSNGMHVVSWFMGPAVDPSGRRLAVTEDDGDDAADLVWWLFVAAASPSPRASASATTARVMSPLILSRGSDLADAAWSPDGRTIATTTYDEDVPGIALWKADGSSPAVTRVTGLPSGEAYRASYSGDGDWLIYTLRRDGKNDVHAFNLGSKRDVALTSDGRSWNGVFSPDGKWIAFLREAAGTIDLYAMELDGALTGGVAKAPIKLTRGEGVDGASRPSWGR